MLSFIQRLIFKPSSFSAFYNTHFRFYSLISGVFFLLNSYIANSVFSENVIAQIPAIISGLILGLPLIYKAFSDLFSKKLQITELAAVSFTASFCTGQYRTASFIALFLTISDLLEYRSNLNARKSIQAIMQLSPTKANVLENGSFIEKNIETLRKDDLLQILPGDRIPGDGIITAGSAMIDESPITGESLPVFKEINGSVCGGSINVSGKLIVKLSKCPHESILANIESLIQNAHKSNTPIMRLIDKFSYQYIPLILIVSSMVLFLTRDINSAISLLIVSCPCTIIMSSPLAFISALGAAARSGVIIKDVSLLETAQKINTVVFDKTGTLTRGFPDIISIRNYSQNTTHKLLSIAGSLERYSHHPAARAIINRCNQNKISFLDVTNFSEIPGMGVEGYVNCKYVALGREEWIRDKCKNGFLKETLRNNQNGIFLFLLIDGKHEGTFELIDAIKPEAAQTLSALRNLSIKNLVMVTGDKTEVAKNIADIINCNFEAEILPRHKMEYIYRAKELGLLVAMIGDGINDAPALAASDISIAMGKTGTDTAKHSASAIIINDDLNKIPFLFRLSKKTVSVIKQNIVFSTIFMICTAALSLFGFILPVSAALLHTFNIVFIILNSARLLKESDDNL